MENLVNVLVEKINSGRTVKFYWGESEESFYLYEGSYFNDYDGGYDELSLRDLQCSLARAIEQGGYCPDLDNQEVDYSRFNLNIIRWLGAFGYGSDLKEAIKFEMSSPREKAGEFITTNILEGEKFDFDPFASLYSDLYKECQIGFIYNQLDVRRVYAVDVWSTVNDEGILVPGRSFDSLMDELDQDDSSHDFWDRARMYQRDMEYNGHTEAFIKAFVRPRGIVIKGKSRKWLPFITKTLKENGINIPIFLTRGCDSHLSVFENGEFRVIKLPY